VANDEEASTFFTGSIALETCSGQDDTLLKNMGTMTTVEVTFYPHLACSIPTRLTFRFVCLSHFHH
jgi:hypothetical protein